MLAIFSTAYPSGEKHNDTPEKEKWLVFLQECMNVRNQCGQPMKLSFTDKSINRRLLQKILLDLYITMCLARQAFYLTPY